MRHLFFICLFFVGLGANATCFKAGKVAPGVPPQICYDTLTVAMGPSHHILQFKGGNMEGNYYVDTEVYLGHDQMMLGSIRELYYHSDEHCKGMDSAYLYIRLQYDLNNNSVDLSKSTIKAVHTSSHTSCTYDTDQEDIAYSLVP